MSTFDPDHREELSDEELDAVLAAANNELLDYVRAKADPSDLLITLVSQSGGTASDTRPANPSLSEDHALSVIQIRRTVRGLDRLLNLTRLIGLDRDLALVSALAPTLNRDLALASALAPALASARAYELACLLDHGLDRDLVRSSDLIRASALASALVVDLNKVAIDVSGLDLSHLDLSDLDVLTGAVWTSDTRWPPPIADEIATRSEEIRPGIYQVRGGSERDPVNLGLG